MLARAVHPLKGLFVQKAGKAVAVRHLFQHLHGKLVCVNGKVGGGEQGRHLVLGRGHLVVLGFGADAQLPQLFVQLFQKGLHLWAYRAKVMVLQLLPFGGARAQQRAAGQHKVRPFGVQLFRNQKILLLGAHGGAYALCLLAKQLQHAHGLAA